MPSLNCLKAQVQPGSRKLQGTARAPRGQTVLVQAVAQGQAGASEQGVSRRQLGAFLALGAGVGSLLGPAQPAQAGFQKELKKRKVPIDEYATLEANGLKYYDLKEGSGSDVVKVGDTVTVHWDALFRGIDVQSSRNARLLGGNRTIAEPFTFVVGEPVYGTAVKYAESSGSLFTGQGGPKPPQALSKAVVGMKKGGKRSLIIDGTSPLGYGDKGVGELPGNTTFELQVEVLDAAPRK